VRDDALEVGDRRTGLLKRFEADGEGIFDYAALSEFLAQVKLRHPEVREAMILLEPEMSLPAPGRCHGYAAGGAGRARDRRAVSRHLDRRCAGAPRRPQMNASRSARAHGAHHKRRRGAALSLVSLMDIFTILVFFLLVNSSDVQQLTTPKSLQMPESIAQQPPRETVVVTVGPDAILVQGEVVAITAEVLDGEDDFIPALAAALEQLSARRLRVDEGLPPEVTILGDRDLPYRLLRKVMVTCTRADYGRVSLAVVQRGAEAA
jgi:biopolymer transport protein TolR